MWLSILDQGGIKTQGNYQAVSGTIRQRINKPKNRKCKQFRCKKKGVKAITLDKLLIHKMRKKIQKK